MSAQPAVVHVRPESDAIATLPTADWDVTTAASIEYVRDILGGAEPDCLLCEHAPDAGLDCLDVLASVRDTNPSLPILVYTAEPDGTVAAEATRLDVTEYITASETDPAERVRSHLSGPKEAGSTASLRALSRLATDDSLTDDEIIERVLELGADRLGVSIGYLSTIEDATYTVTHAVGDHSVVESGVETALSNTYCSRTIQTDGLLEITDATAEGWGDHPAYQMSGLACYLGGEIRVNNELYGTLCFADDIPRSDPFTDDQRRFIELLIAWVNREFERRDRERNLERYEEIIEAVDDGVYALDGTGHFEFVNSAMAELTGYDTEELINEHTSLVKPPDVVDEAETIVREMLFGDRTTEEATFELILQRADGTRFPAEDHMTMRWDDEDEEWFTGTAGIVRDITARKEREQELQNANRRIEQILGRIGAAFFAVDSEWTLTYWNSRAEEVLERDAEAVMGESLWDVFPDAVGSTFYEAYHEAMETKETVSFEEYHTPVGKWFRVNVYPSAEGLSVYFHDITDQKERDRKLSGLLETTRSLMQAHTAEAVAETIVEAARSELDFELNLVRLYDEENDTLAPIAGTDGVPDRPVYDADEGYPGEAFQCGEPVRIDDFDLVETYDSDRINAAMYVPIGDHGVLSVAATDIQQFSDSDVSIAEILASNGAAALDRVAREHDLRRYESVVENVRDMVFVLDSDGRFQLVTEPLADWLGYDRGELVGSHPRLLLDPVVVAEFEDRIRELRRTAGDGTIQMELDPVTADGNRRPAEVELSLIDDAFYGTVGVIRDLTELKRAREQLRDERDRFSYLFNNLPDAVVETEFTDGSQCIRSVNPAFTEVFGFEGPAVLDASITETLHPPDGTDDDRIEAFGGTDGRVQGEIRRRTVDGFRDFLFRGVPYRRDDGRIWSFGIYTDITEQKDRQRRLEVLNRVLRHNLRNDLTVVLGLIDVLTERITDSELRGYLDRLGDKAEQIASLSDRAREIERSVRRAEDSAGAVDLSAMIDSLVDVYEQQYGIDIELSMPAESVYGADNRFRRALDELIENSIEHAGADPTIRIRVETTPDTVVVTLCDDGPGIPDHEIDVLRGDEPITQLKHGSGLGLWLVVWVVESYGGTVRFDADESTTVTMTLSRAR
jgi:PAS domain S-box-containing protein